jgi:hypothetical protein
MIRPYIDAETSPHWHPNEVKDLPPVETGGRKTSLRLGHIQKYSNKSQDDSLAIFSSRSIHDKSSAQTAGHSTSLLSDLLTTSTGKWLSDSVIRQNLTDSKFEKCFWQILCYKAQRDMLLTLDERSV